MASPSASMPARLCVPASSRCAPPACFWFIWAGLGILLAAVLAGCDRPVATSAGPTELTLEQAAATGRRLMVPDPTSAYAYLHPKWFTPGDSICSSGLLTYFLNKEDQREVMWVEVPCALTVDSPDLLHPVSVNWIVGYGYYCQPNKLYIPMEKFSGAAYQTCLTWSDDDHNFLLYSTLPKEPTIQMINRLVPAQ